jgi:hypothetical protein
MWDLYDQMINYECFLSDIKNEKNLNKISVADLFRKYESDPGADYNLFKIAYNYCEDEDLALAKMKQYINKHETTISSLDLLQTESNTIKEDNLITHINVVVQFLTKYARGSDKLLMKLL